MTDATGCPDRRKVFVIHGRNESARKGLFQFLRSIGLNPIEWSQAIAMTGQGSPYIGHVLDAVFSAAQAVVVLETPDDIAYLDPSLTDPGDPDSQARPQPRQNVLFEAGMAMGRNAERTIIVELGRTRGFSDLHGRQSIQLDDSTERRQDLAERLKTAGCAVDLSGRDWHSAGGLTPPDPPSLNSGARGGPPSPDNEGLPQLDARYIRTGTSNGYIEVINLGPGDVYDVMAEVEDQAELVVRGTTDAPVRRLPPGKSVRILRALSLGVDGTAHFTITVRAATVDGRPLEQELFISVTE